MILTAHQPLYLPWLGLFHKISMSDVFCLWGDVQFSPNDFIHRNRIKGPNGSILLTVPIKSHGHREKTINGMEIDNTKNWRKKHWKSMFLNYKNAPYFESYGDFFRKTYEKEWRSISALDEHILKYLLKELGISVKFLRASECGFEGTKSARVLDMCKKLGADTYIFGMMGKDYADAKEFKKAGVELCFQSYKHPIYPQLHGDFLPNMSVVDLLFCMGEKSYSILTKGNPKKYLNTIK